MNRETIARVHILNDLISERETALERLKCRACDPAAASIDRIGGKRSGNLREDHLISYLDNAVELQQSIDRLRAEQRKLHDEIMCELESCKDYYTRKMVIWRLIRCYTWPECADLSGYSEWACRDKYTKWLNTLH